MTSLCVCVDSLVSASILVVGLLLSSLCCCVCVLFLQLVLVTVEFRPFVVCARGPVLLPVRRRLGHSTEQQRKERRNEATRGDTTRTPSEANQIESNRIAHHTPHRSDR